jgi:uncharacterized protein (DUF2267 family)
VKLAWAICCGIILEIFGKGEAQVDELVKMVATKVGISEAQAQQAVEIVLKFLKDKLPDSMAGQVDAVIEGDLSGLDDVMGSVGKLFG